MWFRRTFRCPDVGKSQNRFGGKEIAGQKVNTTTGAPAAAAGSPYLDFGARLYDPRTAAWLSQDPLSEKYYSISPYAYCAGNPVNLVDHDGMDWYTITQTGEFHLIENRPNEGFDRLFVDFTMGPPDLTTSLIIQDKSILPSLSKAQMASYSVNKTEMENLFYFAADAFREQEWGLYANGERYAIATANKIDQVKSPIENITWKIHSHSDTMPNDKEEIQSMGYWFYYENQAFNAKGKLIDNSSPWNEANLLPNDLHNLKESSIPSFVYFPKSGHVYKMNKSTLPTIVKTR